MGVVVTGYGRISTGAHWPSDVLGGALYGLVVVLALALVLPAPPPGPGAQNSARRAGR